MTTELLKPDYLFEVSWEVCNKVGGIHTVIASKANTMVRELKNNYLLIGPDVWRDAKNPEFTEDTQLFRSWREKLAEEGLRVRIGRWNIPSNPIALIVDFTPFIGQKDKIFANLWETYSLDSISGQWDYIEPALFGFAAAKVIESYTRFYLSVTDRVVTHVHEWMTGSTALYLNQYLPQVATVFTTHATVLGRCLAGNNRPLYREMQQYNPADVAREFGVVSKQSLERITANEVDCFTTVSGLTANECIHFLQKPVDVITPNGFDNSLIPPNEEFDRKRKHAREHLLKATELCFGYKVSKDALFCCISGRYEFKNKGIDIFIETLRQLNESDKLQKEIVAFILIPAHQKGPRREILDPEQNAHYQPTCLTHNLHDVDYDTIIRKIDQAGLYNRKEQKVKVIYVPAYLNGNDGFFNLPYYDLLIGMDVSAFPSYYEPWGYTPQESVMFHVPTVTTTLAGFGLWVQSSVQDTKMAVRIINRTDDNDAEVIQEVTNFIIQHSQLSKEESDAARNLAHVISGLTLWSNFIKYYHEAYNIALQKVANRSNQFIHLAQTEQTIQIRKKIINTPHWYPLNIESNLPEKLMPLREISMNLWWSWNEDAMELFERIDPNIWEQCHHNPFILFELVDYSRLLEVEKDEDYLVKLNDVHDRFKEYIYTPLRTDSPRIAYFSMEFGLINALKIYSGGLGILAGDYLKEASDSNYEMIGIGLKYNYGYFRQRISFNGEQMAEPEALNFSKLPVTQIKDERGTPLTVTIGLPGRTLYVQIWRVDVGRVPLYLLDTDIPENNQHDRSITHFLYGGDVENRLKQEIVLGIGGIRMLELLGIMPDIYHCNEGHAALMGLERLRILIQNNNLSYTEAKEVVRSSTLFTTHTPVPAGHDAFTEDMLRTYFPHYPDRYKISWEEFLGLGKSEDHDPGEKFNMSHLAANLAQEVNAVSKLHEKVTKDIISCLWKGYLPEELHIGHVTNGVHFSTWTAKEMKRLYTEEFGESFFENMLDEKIWQRIQKVPDEQIWTVKQFLKKKLIQHIKNSLKSDWVRKHENPEWLMKITETINEEALTIGFARRFATYKRAHLLFRNQERLAKIINNAKMPVQFIFAGKAHPHDKAGQDLIKLIIDMSRRPEFSGKILFLQNYDMALAKKMVQGVDIWVNTPTRPLEASGTSGEKAVMNGTMHFSVLDGWWVEGYKPGAGWMLPEEKSYDDPRLQDDLDAETIYRMLENEIVPLYYKRNASNIPTGWVKHIKNTIAYVSPNFTTRRMIRDYDERFYSKLYKRTLRLREKNYLIPDRLASWKRKISRSWESIEVVSVNIPRDENGVFHIGINYTAEVVIDLNELAPENIGIEIVFTDENKKFIRKQEFNLVNYTDGKATYTVDISPTMPGQFNYGIRIFPKHEDLPHRQDFSLVKWI